METAMPKRRRLWILTLLILVAGLGTGVIYTIYKYIDTRIISKNLCERNLLKIGIAINQYMSAYYRFPSSTSRWSWIAQCAPYLGENPPIFPDSSKPWNDLSNRYMRQKDRRTGKQFKVENDERGAVLCPLTSARTNRDGYGLTNYVGVGGLGVDAPMLPVENPRAGVFGYREGTRYDQIKDGMNCTIAVIETAQANGPWRAPGPSTIRGLDRDRQPYIGKGRQFGGLHREGVMVLFADGAVRFVREEFDPTVFEAMATIAGGERVGTDPQIVNPQAALSAVGPIGDLNSIGELRAIEHDDTGGGRHTW